MGSDGSKLSQMETDAHMLVQSRKLSGIQKDSASEMKNILRKWNTNAYESIDSGCQAVKICPHISIDFLCLFLYRSENRPRMDCIYH